MHIWRILDGDDHEFYAQFNKSSLLKNALIAMKMKFQLQLALTKNMMPKQPK
jgi:hypothetical protein